MATIKKREGKTGVSYLIRSSCGYDTAGRHIEKSMTWRPAPGMTPRQIEKELNRQAVLLDEKTAAQGALVGIVKFQEFAEQWFREYAEPNLRPRTVARLHQLEARTYSAIGHIRLDKITARHVQSFIDNLGEAGISTRLDTAKAKISFPTLLQELSLTQKALAQASGLSQTTVTEICHGESVSLASAAAVAQALDNDVKHLFSIKKSNSKLSPKTIRNYLSFVSSVLDHALRFGMIQGNPCQRVLPPAIRKKEQECYTIEEAQAFLNSLNAAPLQYKAFFALAIYSGMRRSELLGLEWSDVDFPGEVISIQRTSQYLSDRGTFTDDTKTEKSRRALKLPTSVINVLRELRTSQLEQKRQLGDQWRDSQRIFVNPFGDPLHPNTPYHWLMRFCEKTGQRFLGIHAFRHLNASLLINSGADVRTVSASLGHSQVTTTLNIYAHSFAVSQARASDAIANALPFATDDLAEKTAIADK